MLSAALLGRLRAEVDAAADEPEAPEGPERRVAAPEPFAFLSRRARDVDDEPPADASQPVLPLPPLTRVTDTEAMTEPIPVISAAAATAPASQAAGEISVPPAAPPAAPARPAAAALPEHSQEGRAADGPVSIAALAERRPRPLPSELEAPPARRSYRKAGLLVFALALVGAVSAGIVIPRLSDSDNVASRDLAAAGAATRDVAAAWVADQVSRSAIVSCDPVMCQTLESHGVPAGDLLVLRPGMTNPLSSQVIVATPAVRRQLGARLSSVYAPGIIASFGAGSRWIVIRAIAPRGAAAYESALSADLIARQASGAGLLESNRIVASAAARRQLAVGQVDSRLMITMAEMASVSPVDVVAFGDAAPGAGVGVAPLRSAELAGAPGYLQSMAAFLRAQRPPYLAAHIATARYRGKTVLSFEFAAPSPLGLLGPPNR